MAYDDEPTIIGDYLFERHEGVIMCFPFKDDDGNFDDSTQLEYSPCDMLHDLDDVFKSFNEEYKELLPDDIMGLNLKFTIGEWFKFFELALHESVSLITVNRLHDDDRKYSWRRIKEMITPISQESIDVLNCVGMLSDDEFKNYNVGVIESEDEIIITSVIELSLDDLDKISTELRDYCLLKLDNSGYIKYYVFKYLEEF